jgi:hypothetical protein
MFRKNLVVDNALKMAIVAVVVTSGFMLPIPALMTASAQSSVTEVSAPGVKPNEYYIFTQELNGDEEKLGVPVAVFTLTNIIVHKGDTVTIHFYNIADEKTDRHAVTIQNES